MFFLNSTPVTLKIQVKPLSSGVPAMEPFQPAIFRACYKKRLSRTDLKCELFVDVDASRAGKGF